MEICNHAQPEEGDLEYTYDPGGLHMEYHWGVQLQVEYFNPRGGKVACQGKDTCSVRLNSGGRTEAMLGVAQPAALQMSVSEVPCAKTQEEATLRVECAFNPRGHGQPCIW